MIDTLCETIARFGPVQLPLARKAATVGAIVAALVFTGAAGRTTAQTVPAPLPPEPPPVSADGYDFRLELGIEHSDNRARLDPRGLSDTLLIPRVDISAFRSGRWLDLRAIGNVEYRYSLPDRFEDEFRANVQSELDWEIVPDRLVWNFADVASVEPVNVLAVDSPANLQQTNVFATGPALALSTRGPWRSILRARFTASQAEETEEFNTNRTSMLARAIRRLGSTQRLLLEAEAGDVRVRDARFVDAEHRRGDILARYSREGASASLELVGGYTWTDFDTGRSPVEPLGRLELVWKHGDSFRAYLAANHELSDAVRDLLGGLETLDPNPLDRSPDIGRRLRAEAEIFILDSFELGLGRVGLNQRFNIAAFYRDYDFRRSSLEQDSSGNGATLTYTRLVSDSINAGATFLLERRQFEFQSRRDTDLSVRFYLEQRLSRRLAVRASLSRNQRWSNIVGGDSRENIAGLALVFFGGRP